MTNIWLRFLIKFETIQKSDVSTFNVLKNWLSD